MPRLGCLLALKHTREPLAATDLRRQLGRQLILAFGANGGLAMLAVLG